jgi:hypothetical protein
MPELTSQPNRRRGPPRRTFGISTAAAILSLAIAGPAG